MNKLVLIAGCAALAACGEREAPPPAEDANIVVTETESNVAAPAAEVSLAETSWDHMDDGKLQRTSIDGAGNYETNAGSEHVDHGKLTRVDGKACFTSAMNQDGPECWTVQQVEVGQAFESTSDKGNKLTVTRRDYVPFQPRS